MVMSRLLKLALAVDAVATATTGLGLAMAGSSLAGVLGFPAALLQITGVILLPYAAVVAYLAARVDVPPAAIWTVIVVNALWAVHTIALGEHVYVRFEHGSEPVGWRIYRTVRQLFMRQFTV